MASPMNRPRAARSLSDLVRPALADALKAQGFAAADILRHWPSIAGARLAAHSMPVRLMWPARPKAASVDEPPKPATLVLKVEGAFALEVEMSAETIIERINAVFGWRCVGRIRLRQGPIELAEKKAPPPPPRLDQAEEARLSGDLAGIEDEALRRSLERLGRAVRAKR